MYHQYNLRQPWLANLPTCVTLGMLERGIDLIIRPDELEIIEAKIEFNMKEFMSLEVDLSHINKNGRSCYSVLEVKKIVATLIDGLLLSPSGEKEFGDEFCSYFVKTGEVMEKKLKLVFCICSDKPDCIGVITLYNVR